MKLLAAISGATVSLIVFGGTLLAQPNRPPIDPARDFRPPPDRFRTEPRDPRTGRPDFELETEMERRARLIEEGDLSPEEIRARAIERGDFNPIGYQRRQAQRDEDMALIVRGAGTVGLLACPFGQGVMLVTTTCFPERIDSSRSHDAFEQNPQSSDKRAAKPTEYPKGPTTTNSGVSIGQSEMTLIFIGAGIVAFLAYIVVVARRSSADMRT